MAHMYWCTSYWLDMVAKQGLVDFKCNDSVPGENWSNFCTLNCHHDSVLKETWSNHCVEDNTSDRLSHSEETRGLRRARLRDFAPGEETP